MTMLLWAELARERIAEELTAGAAVAIALGAIEQHGPHLPTGTDVMAAQHVVEAAASRASTTVLLLPAIPYGLSHYHMRWGGTVTLGAETLTSVLADVARSVQSCGAQRFFIVNGHGGNRGICATVSLMLSTPDFHVHAFPYWDTAPKAAQALFTEDNGSIGHAGQAETSIVAAFRPDLCHPTKASAHEPISPAMELVAVQRLGKTGVSGNPAAFHPELGRQFLDAVAIQLAALFDGRHTLESDQPAA